MILRATDKLVPRNTQGMDMLAPVSAMHLKRPTSISGVAAYTSNVIEHLIVATVQDNSLASLRSWL